MRKRSYSRPILVVLCSALLITTIMLLAVDLWMKTSAPMIVNDRTNRLAPEPQALSINAAPLPPPEAVADLESSSSTSYILTGTVQEKQKDRFIINTDSSTTIQVLLATQNAVVYKETLKTPKQIQQELRTHSTAAPRPPSPSRTEKMSFTDIPVGGWVRITSQEKIASHDTIAATEIVYLANK